MIVLAARLDCKKGACDRGIVILEKLLLDKRIPLPWSVDGLVAGTTARNSARESSLACASGRTDNGLRRGETAYHERDGLRCLP